LAVVIWYVGVGALAHFNTGKLGLWLGRVVVVNGMVAAKEVVVVTSMDLWWHFSVEAGGVSRLFSGEMHGGLA
jgi:hypothetical protein